MGNERLDSWKAVSKYLDRGLRTVQRWHVEYGMPVRRISGSTGAIFAFTGELDAWLKSRSETVDLKPFRDSESNQLDQDRASELTQVGKRMWRQISEDNMSTIAKIFRKATALDPNNVEAWAELAHIDIIAALTCVLPCSYAYSRASAALSRALEIDPASDAAITNLALFKLTFERDWEGSRKTYLQLVKGKYAYGSLVGRALLKVASGDLRDASEFLLEATHLNPLDAPLTAFLAWVMYLDKNYADALFMVNMYRKCGDAGTLMTVVSAFAAIQMHNAAETMSNLESLLAEQSHRTILDGVRGYYFALSGQPESARNVLDEMTAGPSAEMYGMAYPIALIHMALGDKKMAVQWLKKSYIEGSLWSLAFHLDPTLDSLRGDPDFESLLRKINYPSPALVSGPRQYE